MTATRKDTANAIATVMGSAMMNSPAEPVRIRSGRNEAMIVMVAVSTGTRTSVAHLQAASTLRHLPVQKFDVVVGYDYGVVHHDPEDHDERGDGNLMQGYPHRVHDSEGAAQRYRYGKSRDESDPQGKEYDGNQNHRNDGQQEFVAEIRNPLLDDLRLVGDQVKLNVGGKEHLEALEDLIQLLRRVRRYSFLSASRPRGAGRGHRRSAP